MYVSEIICKEVQFLIHEGEFGIWYGPF